MTLTSDLREPAASAPDTHSARRNGTRPGPGSQLADGGAEDGRGRVDEARHAAAMAARVGLTAIEMANLVALLDLTPEQIRALTTSRDGRLWRAAANVAPLYLEAPVGAVVWSVDEQAGTGPADSVIFCALDVHGRGVAAWITDSSRANFVDFLEDLELASEPGLDVHCIADDRPSHSDAAVRAFLVDHPRVGLHLVPQTAPWLGLVHNTFYPRIEHRLASSGSLDSLAELAPLVVGLVEAHNRDVGAVPEVRGALGVQPRRAWLRRTTDHAWVAMAVALVLAGLFVVAHLVASDGDPSSFVVAGESNAVPGQAPASLHIYPLGYDGQFYYLLALDPAIHTQQAHGMSLDLPAYREQRIVYPVMAWALSGGGRIAALPWALVLINLGAMGALAFMGALLAREAGRHALWGLALPAFPAFLLVLGKDLAEILSAAFLAAGLIMLRRRQVAAATAALTLAVLSKETTAFAVGAIGLVWLLQWVFRRRTGLLTTMRRGWLTFVVPMAGLGAWELFLRLFWHASPIPAGHLATAAPLANVGSFAHQALRAVVGSHVTSGIPHAHLFASASANLSDEVLYLASFVFIVLIGAATLGELRWSSARDHEKAAFLVGVLAVLVLSGITWNTEWSFLRAVSPIWVVAFMVLIAGRRRWVTLPPLLAGGAMSLGFAMVTISPP